MTDGGATPHVTVPIFVAALASAISVGGLGRNADDRRDGQG